MSNTITGNTTQPTTASEFGRDVATGANIEGRTSQQQNRSGTRVEDYFRNMRSRVDEDTTRVQEDLASQYGQLEDMIQDAEGQIARLEVLREKYGVNADEMKSIEILLQEKLNAYTFDLAKGTITTATNSTRGIHHDKLTKLLDGMSDKLGNLMKGRGGSKSKIMEQAERGLKKFKGAGSKVQGLIEKINLAQRVADVEDIALGSLSRATGNYSSGLREDLHGWIDEQSLSDIPLLGQLLGTTADVGADIMEVLGLNTGYKTDKEMVEQLTRGIESQLGQIDYKTGRQSALLRRIGELDRQRKRNKKTEAELVVKDVDTAKEAESILSRNPQLRGMTYRQQQKELRKILSTDTAYARMNRKQKADFFNNSAKWVHRLSNPDAYDVRRRNDLMDRGAYRYVDIHT